MRSRRGLILGAVGVAAVVLVVYLATNPVDTTLEFMVRDAVSENWVWDATFRLQGRVIRSHFQSDQGPLPHLFTRLQPGEATLEISAPSYALQSVPVRLKRGENRLAEAIDLVGLEIPDLREWIIFEERVGDDVVQELRPVSSAGRAVVNHPTLDLWIGARISVQIQDGVPVQQATDAGAERGEELYRGALQWRWDATPETLFRYSSTIPVAEIKANADPYWVVDYLIVVPNPAEIRSQEIDQIMEEAWDLPGESLVTYLQRYENEGRLAASRFTSWNVPRAQR